MNREDLGASLESWQQSASHDRKQFLASFAISGMGLLVCGEGIGTIANGALVPGVIEIILGGGLTTLFARNGLNEVESYAETERTVAFKQYQLDELDAN